MAWNKPGDDDNDPWKGRDNQDTPPDLDEAIRTLQEKLNRLFSGDNEGGTDNASNNQNAPGPARGLAGVVFGALALWLASGFYIVDEGHQGVETRFGKYVATTDPGLKWHFPAPIEQKQLVNVDEQRLIEVGYRSAGEPSPAGNQDDVTEEALMLTQDENIINVHLNIQYRVKNAQDFLFSLANPEATLLQVAESAERGAIGSNAMDFTLIESRSEIVSQIKKEIQAVMDSYHSGIEVVSVNLKDAQPPEQVQKAFEDVTNAREDKKRFISEAEAYANDIIPKAEGEASRKLQEAQGYKEQVIAQAEGEVSRFAQLLTQYKKSPEITRQRMYVETMEAILAKTNTVMVDVKNNNMIYLPLDKKLQPPASTGNNPAAEPAPLTAPVIADQKKTLPSIMREAWRGREERGR